MVVDIRDGRDCAWPSDLEPIKEGWDREEFSVWFARAKQYFGHLHEQILEQWPYRHWEHSPYRHFAVADLKWCKESWPTDRILAEVRQAFLPLDAAHDLQAFQKKGGEPAETMDRVGTWNIPILTLHTPEGVIGFNGEQPDVRYWLIEGHSRLRYLNALASLGRAAETHELYILERAS